MFAEGVGLTEAAAKACGVVSVGSWAAGGASPEILHHGHVQALRGGTGGVRRRMGTGQSIAWRMHGAGGRQGQEGGGTRFEGLNGRPTLFAVASERNMQRREGREEGNEDRGGLRFFMSAAAPLVRAQGRAGNGSPCGAGRGPRPWRP